MNKINKYEVLYERVILILKGPNIYKLMQNLITNNLEDSDYIYTYMINNQGKYLFDFFLLKLNKEKILVDIHCDYVKIFIEKINLYKLRDIVEIFYDDEHSIIYSNNKLYNVQYSFQDPRYCALGYRSMIKKNLIQEKNLLVNIYLNDKYSFAIPDGFSDMEYEISFPLEYGAEELNGISYRKGCYLGQEVMSRIKYQGVLRKGIFHVTAYGNISSFNKSSISTKNVLGRICSVFNNQGIALAKIFNITFNEYIIININDELDLKLSIPQWRKNIVCLKR